MEIYQPAEDSYFFANFLKKYLVKNSPFLKMLDMGTGSGILSETSSEFLNKKNILVADINPSVIKTTKQKGFNSIKTNLFQNIKNKFDIITFNAPYLPLDSREPKSSQLATTGGKRGDEISIKFLKQARQHLNKNGKIFLLISSLTPLDKIKKFNPKIVARKKIFMEELLILEFKRKLEVRPHSSETSSYQKFLKYSNEKEKIAKKLKEIIPKNSKYLLDIGAGNGYIEKAFSKYFKEIIAIEPSKKLFSKLKNLKLKNLKNLRIKFEDYNKDKKFGIIISSYSIQYIENRKGQLKRIKKILEDKGKFIIIKNRHSGKYYEFLNSFRSKTNNNIPELCPDKLLMKDLKDAGFSTTKIIIKSELKIPSKKEFLTMSDFFLDIKSGKVSEKIKTEIKEFLNSNFEKEVIFEIPHLIIIATKSIAKSNF